MGCITLLLKDSKWNLNFHHHLHCTVVAVSSFMLFQKPSLKIGLVNKTFLFWYWQRLNFFFSGVFFLFFKIESWNFQNLFEKEFRETSQNFNSIRQPIEKMKITIVWISWMSWNFVRFHEIQFQTDVESLSFYLEKQKCFIPNKNIF